MKKKLLFGLLAIILITSAIVLVNHEKVSAAAEEMYANWSIKISKGWWSSTVSNSWGERNIVGWVDRSGNLRFNDGWEDGPGHYSIKNTTGSDIHLQIFLFGRSDAKLLDVTIKPGRSYRITTWRYTECAIKITQ